jgi:glycoprotein endo-alpha-1,2-mannosidase
MATRLTTLASFYFLPLLESAPDFKLGRLAHCQTRSASVLMAMLLCFLGSVRAADAQAPGGAEAQAVKPLVGADYYAGYGATKSESDLCWMRKARRGRLEPRQLPKLGVYDSRNAETIGSHIAQSKRGGIDFWVVSWWGPSNSRSDAFKNHILPHADAGKLKYAIFYESTGRFGPFDKPSFKTLVDDFKFMAENYFDNPHYLRIDGKPVVYIYLTRAYFRDRGHDELRRLREALPEVYLVGDDVFDTGKAKNAYRPEHAQLWDAVTAYDVYGQSSKSLGGTRAALDK